MSLGVHAFQFAITNANLNKDYLWVYIVVGIVGLVGVGGIVGFVRWLKTQAVRDSKIDELIDPAKGVMAQMREHGKQLADLQRSMRPNGLDTDQLGDIAKRTEREVVRLRADFSKHLGSSEEIHRELREKIAKKQDRRPPR
jgi:hypothetical protein